VFIKQLKDPDPAIRRTAADALAKRDVRRAADALVERVADAAWVASGDVIVGLDKTPYDDRKNIRGSKLAALEALRKLAPDRVEEALLKAMTSTTAAVRQWALMLLASEKREAAVPAALGALKDAKADVRLTAVQVLDKYQGEAIVQELAKALKDGDSQVRRAAADSLGQRGEKAKAAVPALIERVADNVWAASGVVILSHDKAAYDDRKDRQGSKEAALQALTKLAPEKVEEALAKALDAKNARVRAWATKKLAP
jgi:HEAT repeat protein